MAPILEMLDGKVMDFVGLGQSFSLKTPRSYRGRVGVAIPSSGIILPKARGGKAPVAHSISNLPSGLSFNAGTRAVTGNPTSAHATRAVTYSATDSSTPAETVNATFQFPVVSSSADITRDDFDHRGYGLSTRTTYLLALLESTVNVAGSDVIVFRRPPQSGAEIGSLLDDDGNALTDQAGLTITAAGESVAVDQIQFLISSDRVELKESTSLHFGTYIATTLSAPSLYLRIGSDENEISYDRGFNFVRSRRIERVHVAAFRNLHSNHALRSVAVLADWQR